MEKFAGSNSGFTSQQGTLKMCLFYIIKILLTAILIYYQDCFPDDKFYNFNEGAKIVKITI